MQLPASNRSQSVADAARAQLARYHFTANPYFTSLADGSMTLGSFQRSQRQFFHAVTYFARPMASLLARIDDPKRRLDILHNLVEEHGDFDVSAFHHTTFHHFLKSIGVEAETIMTVPQEPQVKAFNSALSAACAIDEIEVGVACMGAIECMFADISVAIGQGVVARGWLTAEQLTHYKLHAEIDHRHADEFFGFLEPQWTDVTRQRFIRQGLALGAYIFDRLYRDLYWAGLE